MKKLNIFSYGNEYGGYPNALFMELSLALKHSGKELGYNTNVHYNASKDSIFDRGQKAINIFIQGYYTFKPKNSYNILIQPEQHFLFKGLDYSKEYYNNHDKVLEIFPNEVIERNSKSVYFPIGYSPIFDNYYVDKNVKFEIQNKLVAYGALTHRREDFINKFNVTFLRNCFCECRDALIYNNTIININEYAKYNLAPLRTLFSLCKGRIPLQDRCIEESYGIYKKYLKYEFIPETFEYVLRQYQKDDTKTFGEWVRNDLKENHNLTMYLKEVLNET